MTLAHPFAWIVAQSLVLKVLVRAVRDGASIDHLLEPHIDAVPPLSHHFNDRHDAEKYRSHDGVTAHMELLQAWINETTHHSASYTTNIVARSQSAKHGAKAPKLDLFMNKSLRRHSSLMQDPGDEYEMEIPDEYLGAPTKERVSELVEWYYRIFRLYEHSTLIEGVAIALSQSTLEPSAWVGVSTQPYGHCERPHRFYKDGGYPCHILIHVRPAMQQGFVLAPYDLATPEGDTGRPAGLEGAKQYIRGKVFNTIKNYYQVWLPPPDRLEEEGARYLNASGRILGPGAGVYSAELPECLGGTTLREMYYVQVPSEAIVAILVDDGYEGYRDEIMRNLPPAFFRNRQGLALLKLEQVDGEARAFVPDSFYTITRGEDPEVVIRYPNIRLA